MITAQAEYGFTRREQFAVMVFNLVKQAIVISGRELQVAIVRYPNSLEQVEIPPRS
jgi:hypothetical protein